MTEQRRFPGLTPDAAKGSFLLRNARDAEELAGLMGEYRLGEGHLRSFLEDIRHNPSLLDPYLARPIGANRYKLGLVAAGSFPLSDTSPIGAKFNPDKQEGVNFQVTSSHDDWMLCPTAEDLMQESLRNQAVVLVNGALLMKFTGKLTGLCTRSFSTTGATFLEGNWYSPVDPESRETIRQVFDRGEPRVSLTEGLWIILRSVDDSPKGERVLVSSRLSAANLPVSFPGTIRGIQRREFRMKNFEAMD